MNFFALPNDASLNTAQLDTRMIDYLSSRHSKRGLSENSKRAYERAIRDFNHFISSKGLPLNEESLKAYFDSISHKAPTTLNQRKYALLKVIKAQFGDTIFKAIALEKMFEKIPTYFIDRRVGDDETLTEEQVKHLMDEASSRTRLIIHFLFQTACRISETLGIRLSACEILSDKVKIRITGKGKKIREVFIRHSLYQEIRHVYQGKTWLFETRNGKPLDRKNVWRQIKKAGLRMGLKGIHPHTFRHTRATDMIVKKNVSVKATSQYLGHSTAAITLDMYVKDRVDIDALFGKDLI